MPVKPRDQWVANPKLQAARERVHGRKSRTPFANAVKRRCEERFGGHCGVDHRKRAPFTRARLSLHLSHQASHDRTLQRQRGGAAAGSLITPAEFESLRLRLTLSH